MAYESRSSMVSALFSLLRGQRVTNAQQATEQIGILLMLKWVEEEDALRSLSSSAENTNYRSVFDGHNDCRWSVFRTMSGDTMLMHLRGRVVPYLADAPGEDHDFARQAIGGAIILISSGQTLSRMVEIIDQVNVRALFTP